MNYEWLEARQHVLKRPDTYIGPVNVTEISGHIFKENDNGQIVSQNTSCIASPALFKMFDEIITNAIDNSKRSSDQKCIKANVTNEGVFSCTNDGDTIPIQLWENTNRYIPEILFMELMSGENFKDKREQVGGRNGLGAKIVNLLSSWFLIEIVNIKDEKKYKQLFRNNSFDVSQPVVSKLTQKDKKSSLTISWLPDYKRLGMQLPLQQNIIDLFKTRLYDAAACTNSNISVFFANTKLAIKNMKDYALILGGQWIGKDEIIQNSNTIFEVCLSMAETPSQSKIVGFCNGLQCSQGTHVEMIYRRIIEVINDILKKKLKKTCAIRPQIVKDNIIAIINININNPSFTSQTKEKLDTNVDKFGFKYTISPTLQKQIEKSDMINNMIQSIQSDENKQVSKSLQQTKRQKNLIPKYQRALKSQANLYITEGDSALAMCLSGFTIIGRDKNGAFPLRGKLLNTFGMKAKNALEHKEIMNLTQILQLEPNKIYDETNTKQLPYRHIIIFTDQDTDGSHIMGLVLTYLREFFPSILTIWPNFVQRFATHIVKAKIGNDTKAFFSLQEYKAWIGDRKPSQVKYYKGLGTSTDEEAREYFRNIQTHLTEIEYTGNTSEEAIQTFFSPDKTNKRKEILQNIDKTVCIDYKSPKTTFEDFCYKELIHHCAADNVRSIPNAIDGLKPSQRKILYTVRRRQGEMKVASLAANTTDLTAYHHGEASLVSSIMAMAQKHIGTNNLAYLQPLGQFGSRLTKRDKGLAQPRYVFTKKNQEGNICDLMFRPEDDAILHYEEDDGKMIEPTYFVPVIASVLVNGSEGIGTGYKTFIPNHNPIDIIHATKQYINTQQMPNIIPSYNKFLGTTTKEEDNFIFVGNYNIQGNVIEITELPPRVWVESYMEWIHKYTPDYVQDIMDQSVKEQIKIIIKCKHDVDLMTKNIIDDFNLSLKITMSQMHLFNANNHLIKYNLSSDIIKDHAKIRLETYKKRIDHQITQSEIQLNLFKNKARFVQEVSSGKIIITNQKKQQLRDTLKTLNYYEHEQFDYLLDMKIFTLTTDEVQKMISIANEMQNQLNTLKQTTPTSLWLTELDELEEGIHNYMKTLDHTTIIPKKKTKKI